MLKKNRTELNFGGGFQPKRQNGLKSRVLCLVRELGEANPDPGLVGGELRGYHCSPGPVRGGHFRHPVPCVGPLPASEWGVGAGMSPCVGSLWVTRTRLRLRVEGRGARKGYLPLGPTQHPPRGQIQSLSAAGPTGSGAP